MGLASLCLLRCLRDDARAKLLEHLARDGVDLCLGYHVAFSFAFPGVGSKR
jgi:hypothetical protein